MAGSLRHSGEPEGRRPEDLHPGLGEEPAQRVGRRSVQGRLLLRLPVTFVPNEKWWGNKPKLDKIVYKQMADTASLNAFQNGEIDA